ncbi:MAG: tetratricopeptide repeat protein, partial [Candidatus Delongbacteria bacterium]|nr:tetratricopeptide repeat protein [Candidatus Delongbacteria bacterium]
FDEYIYLKDYCKAEEILKKMNRYTYGDIKYYSDSAEYFTAKSEYIKARNILLDGIKEFPESSLGLQLASLFLLQNDYSNAEIIYDEILDEFPDSDYLYKSITNEYSNNDNFDKANKVYEKALEKFPEDPELLNNYSYLLARNSKNLEKALEYVDKALKDQVESISFLDTKAWVLYKMGKYAEAEAIMDGIFSDENAFHHSSSEELFEHFKEIKIAVNKADVLNGISLNKTVIILSEILTKSNYILQTGL